MLQVLTQKKTTPIIATDIRIITQSIHLTELLMGDPTLQAMKNLTFPDRVTPTDRTNFHVGQFFIIIDFVDSTPGDAPWGSYESFVIEALEKGAESSILIAWGDLNEILIKIKDWVMGELRCVTLAG